MSFIRANIADVQAHVRSLLTEYPELVEDDQLREDTILGETDIDAVASRIVRIIKLREANAKALAEYIAELQERKARELHGADGARKMLRDLMQFALIDKLTLPEATVSITKPRVKVNIIDVNELPQGFYAVERKPKSAEIKAALEAGEQVPGAELVLGEDGLMVRTK